MMILVFRILFILTISPLALGWTPRERQLYIDRHFLEINHLLIVQNKVQELKLMHLQESDLMGCRNVKSGRGGVDSMLQCMRFLNRETTLKLFTPGRKRLIGDINLLCPSLLTGTQSLSHAFEEKVFRGSENTWKSCNESAWRQVYLTIYANFEANPVGSLAFFRRAEAGLVPNSLWTEKIRSFLNPVSIK